MAFRISTMPPVPRPSRPTSSREVYLRRNLQLSSASKIASRGNGSAPSLSGRKPTSRQAPPQRPHEPLLCSHHPSHSATWQWQVHYTAAKARASAQVVGRIVAKGIFWISGEPAGAPHGYGEPAVLPAPTQSPMPRSQNKSQRCTSRCSDRREKGKTTPSKAIGKKIRTKGCGRQENLRCISQARILARAGILTASGRCSMFSA